MQHRVCNTLEDVVVGTYGTAARFFDSKVLKFIEA